MKRLSMMNTSSLTRKAIATFTSVAFAMTVALPAPVYAAEGESASTQSETTAQVVSNDEMLNSSAELATDGETATTDAAMPAEATDSETTDATGEAAVDGETPEVNENSAATSEEAPVTDEPQANETPNATANVAEPAVTTDSETTDVTSETAVASETPEADTNPAATSEEAPATKKSQANRMMRATTASPAASIAVGDFEVQGDSSNYTYENGVLTVLGDVIVKTVKTTTNHIVIAENANVSLAGIDISMGTEKAAAIKVNAGVTAVLTLVANTVNTVVGGANYAGVEVAWEGESNFADLTIDGEGALNATGGGGDKGSAGIGGSYDEKVIHGNITIDGGTITANGTGRSAGIGSSGNRGDSYKYTEKTLGLNSFDQWGTITINGGTVTAYGVGSGAGIGGGNHMDSGTIVINGGTVKAEGDSGIGSGLGSSKDKGAGGDKGPGAYYADITINGGDVTAYATNSMGAGIGGGMYGDGIVTINGGTVTASVNTNGKAYQGGAGIGGGYQGAGSVVITGGTITAHGGNGSAGIGNGALAASTTSSEGNEVDGWTGTKNVRTGIPKLVADEIKVVISGGNVKAYGGYAGAGIGSGNSSEWSNVFISGGDVLAVGYASSEDDKEGAAGIGSGASWVENKTGYMKQTTENIAITGGNVIAIGGWGAAGIGSGAKNDTADSITIDAENANVQAYADGTKFAIDTPIEAAGSNTDVTGNLLQGTFVHAYKHEGNVQGTEGLASIILKDEATGTTKTLVRMPDGYRSYATDVVNPGIYTIYTDSNTIGATGENQNGSGAHFSVYGSDQFKGDVEGGMPVTYGVVTDELSNYTYLFPVKTIIVDTAVEIADPGNKTMKEALAGVNQSFFFAIHDHKGETPLDNDGNPWIQEIKVVNGQVMGSVYFANMNDGKFEIWEVDENGNRLSAGTELGEYLLTMIRTEHGSASDNNAELGKGVWTDVVRVINTLALSADPVPPVTPDDPQDPEDPEDPVTPEDPQDPEDPATPEEPQDPEDPESPENPVTPIVPAGPTTPTTPPTTPGAPTGTTTPTTLGTPTGTTTPTAPAASIAVEDGANPLAASIEDEANPLAHNHGIWCWVHWWIILGIIATAVYTVVVVARRQKNSSELKNIDDEVTGGAKSNDAQSAPNFKLQPAMSASMEG